MRSARHIVIAWTLLAGVCRAVAAAETFVTADALFLQRDNDSDERPLVVDSTTATTAIGAADLRFPVAGGVKLLVGRHEIGERGWELGYLGVYGMQATTSAAAAGTLDIAPDLSSEVASLRNASLADASYGSVINSCEANLLLTGGGSQRPRVTGYAAEGVGSTRMVDWLAGFRWAGLEETASITLVTPGQGSGRYAVRSSSNLFGGQLGVRGRLDWDRWGLEGQAKAALAGVALAQSQSPIIDPFYRGARGSQGGDVGGIFDWNVAVVRHLGERWSVRAGYTMLWLTGVALAPDQFDFGTSPDAGTGIVGNKSVWLQGATLGLEGRW